MRRISLTVGTSLCALLASAPPAQAQEYGPPRGHLVVSGGAPTTSHIIDRFIELAGGPEAQIVVVPTSGGLDQYDEGCPCLEPFRRAGAHNLTILHTRDRNVANSDAFVAPLKSAGGVWFEEGNAWRHQDAYLDTKVHAALFALLDRGGVVGGGSAGARIQSDFLPLRSAEPTERAIPERDWRRGFRLLKNVIIDPHVLVRNRQFDLIGMVNAHPGMLGIGIDENTAIVVQGDSFEVIGTSYVLIYDRRFQILPEGEGTPQTGQGLFFFLRPGDTYEMTTGQASRPGSGQQPFGRVVQKPWGSP
jgi:cyanophycinase